MVDLKELHAAYTRLSEKFKTFWTFHQFLQGIHKTFFGDVPGYKIDFQTLYDQIKSVTGNMTFQAPALVLDQIHRFELQLDVIYRSLAADDQKISPNYVRRFFEKVRTEDEKLLMSLLRFYFYSQQATPDALDKIDFLLTLVGTRRSLDDGHFLPRFPIELEKLFSGFLGLVKRAPPDAVQVKGLVKALGTLKREIDECTRFDELTDKKILENIRTLKHQMGAAFYSVELMSGIVETNLAAKNKFFSLYEEEERKIVDSSRQLLEMEQKLESNPRFKGDDVQGEFRRFRQFKDDFERQNKEKGIRHGSVTRLSESIGQMLTKFELTPETTESDSTEIDSEGLVSSDAASAADSVPAPSIAEESPPAAEGDAHHAPRTVAMDALSAQDPLTAEHASRVLYSIELIDEGSASKRKVYDHHLSRLRLESWEIRAARRILNKEVHPDPVAHKRDVLFFDGAVLRLKIDEEARALRSFDKEQGDAAAFGEKLNECGLCLIRAQEVDRRFRFALETFEKASVQQRNELNRSRFRLLRGFAGLWLLHNTHAEA